MFDRLNIPGTLEDLLADDIPVVTNYSMLVGLRHIKLRSFVRDSCLLV